MKVKEWQARNAIRKIHRGKMPSKRQQAALDSFLAECKEDLGRSEAIIAEAKALNAQTDRLLAETKLLDAMQASGRIREALPLHPNGTYFDEENHGQEGFVLPDGRLWICFDAVLENCPSEYDRPCLDLLLDIPALTGPHDPAELPRAWRKFHALIDCGLVFVRAMRDEQTLHQSLAVDVYAKPTAEQLSTLQATIEAVGGRAEFVIYAHDTPASCVSPFRSIAQGTASSAAEVGRAAEEAFG